MQEMKNIRQRKTMLLAQRNVQTVIRSGRLQLKIERPAKSLSQCQSPRLIDPPAERRVDHQLHAAALIKKSLRDDLALRWHRSQNRAAFQNVPNDLLRSRVI